MRYWLGTAVKFDKKARVAMRRMKGAPEDLSALESYLCDEYKGVRAVGLRNGRSAIAAALRYGLGEGSGSDEVIINGFTCYAVVLGVKAAGYKPVYADINEKDLNFTIKTLEKVVTPRTRAIIVQNTFGNMVDMVAIEKFARKHKLYLIEDLAHCVGRFYSDGREAGTVGAAVAFSFGKEKSIDVTSGGAVVFREEPASKMPEPKSEPPEEEVWRARWYPTFGAWYRALLYPGLSGILMRLLLKFGMIKRSADGPVDLDSHLDYFQARMALQLLKERGSLKSHPLREFALVRERATVLKKLRAAGYYFGGFWYEKPVSPTRYYKNVDFPEDKCPVSVSVTKRIVNLPTNYTEAELKRARKIIKEYVDEQ